MEENRGFKEISEEDFYAQYRFSFGAMLDLEVLNRDYRTFCFINPFAAAVEGERFVGESFEDLFRLTKNGEKEITFGNLLEIRKKFPVTKRAHPILPAIAEALTKMCAGAGEVFIRQSKNFAATYWKADLASYFEQDDWIAYLPAPEGEFQVFDAGCTWLVNARDDDFLNFLIVPNAQAEPLAEAAPGLFLNVAGKG